MWFALQQIFQNFKDKRYQFIDKNGKEYEACGKAIVTVEVTPDLFYIKTRTDELKIPCEDIKKVTII